MKKRMLNPKIYLLIVLSAGLISCGGSGGGGSDEGDSPSNPDPVNSPGSVSITGEAFSGLTLEASVTDTNGTGTSTISYIWSADDAVIDGETSSSLVLTDGMINAEISVQASYTDDDGFAETVEATTDDRISPATTLTAHFVKGPVSGGSCEVFAVSDTGVIDSVALAMATTNTLGVATFTNILHNGPVMVACNGGTYIDEATGAARTAPELRAVIDSGIIEVVVSPLTEVAVQQAEAANDSAIGILTAVTLYNTDNTRGFNVAHVVPTNLQLLAAEDDDSGHYATLLAIISQLAVNQGADTAEELADLIEEFANEQISDEDISDAADDFSTSGSDAANNISAAIFSSVVDDLDLDIAVNFTGVATITGIPQEGETLTASVTDINGTSTSSFSYEWFAGTTLIDGETSSTLLLSSAQIQQEVSVVVTYVDDEGFAESITSNQTDAVIENSGSNGDNVAPVVDDNVPSVNCDVVYTSTSDLEDNATREMAAGTTLCLADSANSYNGLELDFGGAGTADAPITVASQTSGGVTIEGEVGVRMSGTNVVLQGFIFKDGESASSDFLQTRGGNNEHCHYCRITEISVINLDADNADDRGRWIHIYGTNNRVDHSWFSGKRTGAPLLATNREIPDDGSLADVPENYHVIDHNYFGDRPPTDGKAYASTSDNEYEGVQLGTSEAHAGDAFITVAHNYFERIEGEAEVISNKSGNNTIFNNTVRDSYGSITNRHGSSATIANNFVIGDGHPFSGGLRLVDDGHRVINNYVEGARFLNTRFHGGIVLHNTDGSTSNGYQVFENVLVAHNTITDSVNSLNVNGGNQSAPPMDVRFVNNIIDDAVGAIIVEAEEDGMPANSVYAGNYVEGTEFSDDDGLSSFTGFTQTTIDLQEDDLGIARPSLAVAALLTADVSADISPFAAIDDDMDGQLRSGAPTSGSDEDTTDPILYGVLSAADVGPVNYRPPVTEAIIKRVPIANDGFDMGAESWTLTSPAEVTTDVDEIFARGASGKITDPTGRISQTVTVEPDTNYALTAFTQGPVSLGAVIGGTEVTGDFDNSDYRFSQFEFNSGNETSVTLFAGQDSTVENNVNIEDSDFTDFDSSASDDNPWVIIEGGDIGQVQRSSNSASGSEGSLRFRYNTVDEDGSPMVSQVLTGIQENTDYELSVWVRADDGITGTIGIYEGTGTNELTSKLLDFEALEAADAPEGDDDFRQDTLSFNSGSNTTLTLFISYTENMIHIMNPEFESSGNIGNSDLRLDDIELTFEGAPDADAISLFDEMRLVSFPGD